MRLGRSWNLVMLGVTTMMLSRMAVKTRAFLIPRRSLGRRIHGGTGNSVVLKNDLSRRWATTSSSSSSQDNVSYSSMENLYKEWTLQEDETLWKYRNESTEQLAARLG